jgi:hypothetical protein
MVTTKPNEIKIAKGPLRLGLLIQLLSEQLASNPLKAKSTKGSARGTPEIRAVSAVKFAPEMRKSPVRITKSIGMSLRTMKEYWIVFPILMCKRLRKTNNGNNLLQE